MNRINSGKNKETAGAVLVVEDDEMVRQLVKTMLEKQGAPVLTARSGAESVETYRKNERNIRWVLVDMGVEGSSGKGTFEELSRIRPDVRVIVTSGRDREQTLAGFTDRKPFGYLRKPFRMDTLASTARFVASAPGDLTPGVV